MNIHKEYLVITVLIIFTFATIAALIYSRNQMRTLTTEETRLDKQLEALTGSNLEIKTRIRRLSDPERIDHIARKKFKMQEIDRSSKHFFSFSFNFK